MPGKVDAPHENFYVMVCNLHWKAFSIGDIIDLNIEKVLEYEGGNAYKIPDRGNGEPGYLPLECIQACSANSNRKENITEGEILITRVRTLAGNTADAPTPELQKHCVEVPVYPGYSDQQLQVYLPAWKQEPETVELINTRSGEQILNEDAMNYIGGHHLNMKLTDLMPGFYKLYVHYPGEWKHEICIIKKFPWKVNTDTLVVRRQETMPLDETVDDLSSEIKNMALKLNLEWGENFGKPIGPRILLIYPDLLPNQIEALEHMGNETKYAFWGLYTGAINHKTITVEEVYRSIKAKYTWINDENLSIMASQGNYYAMRE